MMLLSARDHKRLMGVQCRIEAVAPDAPLLVERCFEMVADLEFLWSRFLPASDISRVNRSHGIPTRVDQRTVSLIAAMKAAFAATRGSFNPTRLPDQIAAGDARSLVSDHQTVLPPQARPWHSLDDVDVRADGTVVVPDSMTLDAGGIGKGLAADLVSEFALANGADAVCVNLGGDIRVANAPGSMHDFAVDVLSPFDADRTLCTVSLRNGAIATSTLNARRRGPSGIDNHIQGSHGLFAGASVIASTAVWAEVWAKHVLVSPVGLDDVQALGLAAHAVDHHSAVRSTPTWQDFTPC